MPGFNGQKWPHLLGEPSEAIMIVSRIGDFSDDAAVTKITSASATPLQIFQIQSCYLDCSADVVALSLQVTILFDITIMLEKMKK